MTNTQKAGIGIAAAVAIGSAIIVSNQSTEPRSLVVIQKPSIQIIGGQVLLRWTYPTPIYGFNIYYTPQPIDNTGNPINVGHCFDHLVQVTNTSATITNLEPGRKYFFVMTATDGTNESDFSPELAAVPLQWFKVRFDIQGDLQYSPDLETWTPGGGIADGDGFDIAILPDTRSRFFRVVAP